VLADEVSNAADLTMFNDYQFNFTVGPAPSFGACADPVVPIHFIQGSGLSTPILGTTVVVEAVVVGSYQGAGQFSGFFLQERDDRVDGDPMTSEGIFVFHTSTAVTPPAIWCACAVQPLSSTI
jgi:predicted extracellular nuclease